MAGSAKILSLDEARTRVRAAQTAGESVVLCHGCFDIVHPGHVRHLQHAASLGERLLVSITGDALVEKGTGRPLISQELRAENLAALDCVNWVVVNAQPTAVELLEHLRPDVYVKGQEYQENLDPRFEDEKRVVETYGGRLVFSSGDVVFSSTALIDAMELALDPARAQVRPLLEREGVDREAVDALVGSFRGLRITVVGETIIDTYVMCDRPAVASEGPLMTLRPVECRKFDGGAAVIACHLAAMGARVRLITALPESRVTRALERRLAGRGIEVESLPSGGRPLEKQRYLVGTNKIMRLELGDPVTLDAAGQTRLVEAAVSAARETDALIIADYGQGLFSSTVMKRLCARVRPYTALLVGDVSGRRSSLLAMLEADLLCPSEAELREALHDYDRGLSTVIWKLLHETRARGAIVTVGSQGAVAVARPPETTLAPDDWRTPLRMDHVPALAGHAVDPLGCGDALLAAATLTRAAGGTPGVAAIVGSVAAAAEAQRLGNAVIGAADLRRGLHLVIEARLTVTAPSEPPLVSAAVDQLYPAHT